MFERLISNDWMAGVLTATICFATTRGIQTAPKNPITIRSAHTRLLVTDFDREFRFFRDVLGFKPTFGKEGQNYADFEAGGFQVALFKRRLMSADVGTVAKPVESDSQDRAALIFDVPDVDQAAARIKATGARLVTEPHDRKEWGIRVAHFRDPDGNLIEINHSLGH